MTMVVTKQLDEDASLRNRKKRKLYLNFSALCVVWLFNFTAFNGLQNLQAALNADTGILSLATVTIGGVISCMFAPTIISFVGCKGTIMIACVGQAIFIVANYYPKPFILISGAGITGLASGLLWTVQGSYVTNIGFVYHKLTGENFERVLNRLFGIFFMCFQSTQIWGNLISSIVFQFKEVSIHYSNNSFCGADFCPSNMAEHHGATGNATTDAANQTHVTVLISVYLVLTVVSFFIALFMLKPIKMSTTQTYVTLKDRFVSNWQLLISDSKIFLLLPIFLYTGIEMVVMFVQFTTSFVSCKIGYEWIGYTMLCFGACDTIGSLLCGILGRYTGRIPMFVLGTVLSLGTLCLMRFWPISDDVSPALFFIIPALWGICDAIWVTQSQALVGMVFHNNSEPAFAVCIMCQAIGSAVAYIYNIYLCESVKLYIVASVLVVAVSLVVCLEVKMKRLNSSMVEEKGRNNEKLLKSDNVENE